jgi:hypothetical protein
MENIKIGDVLVSSVTGQKIEVRAVIGSIIFSRILNEDGSKSPTTFDELEDLITLSGFSL